MKQHPIYERYYVTENGEVYREPLKRDYTQNKVGDNGLVKIPPMLRGNPGYPEHHYYSVNVSLYENGKVISQKLEYIHRLVAETYIDNPNNYTEIDHIDRNKKNNSVDNLQWISRYENMQKTKITWNEKKQHQKT